AIKNIVNYPASFGLVLQPIINQPYFAPVVTARHIDVKLAAEMADISLEEFTALNPAHNRPVILQQNADVLLLPVDKVSLFRTNLEQHSASLVSWQAYKSKKGERLDKLAPRFGLSLEKLCSINGLSIHAKLRPGQELLVPRMDESAENEFEVFNTHLAASDPFLASAVSHTVRRGDTLSSIARRYHVSLAKLKSWNKNTKILHPGQRIYVMQSGKSQRLKTKRKKHIDHF
ncbi:MAG: LysM peptidoglycan-binding domain-containing protein, partial [Gallionellaceae bacterium]|nr:LysM peptidoglycan-binding domain-containing protein [Gallionellaceae bacterium]